MPFNKSIVTPRKFGAVGDGVAADDVALQNMFDYCSTKGISKVEFDPDANHKLDVGVDLPVYTGSNSSTVRRFDVEGNGCHISTTNQIVMFRRYQADYNDSHNGIYWNPIIRNFSFKGTAGVGDAIEIHRGGGNEVSSCHFDTMNRAVNFIFCLHAFIANNTTTSCRHGYRLGTGTSATVPGVGYTAANAPSNASTIINCRHQSVYADGIGYEIANSGVCKIQTCISEGSLGDKAVYIHTAGSGNDYRACLIQGLWIEYTTALNDMVHIDVDGSVVEISQLHFGSTRGALLINAEDSSDPHIILRNSQFYAPELDTQDAWFKNGTNNKCSWSFYDINIHEGTAKSIVSLWDPIRWVGGAAGVPFHRGRNHIEQGKQISSVVAEFDHTNQGWEGKGTTPPTVDMDTLEGRDNVRKTTFTNASDAGFAGSRAEYAAAAADVPVSLGGLYRFEVDVKVSRALVASEELRIYYTGTMGLTQIAITTANDPGTVWTTFKQTPIHNVVADGTVSLRVYIATAITGGDIDVFMSLPKFYRMADPDIDSQRVKTNKIQRVIGTAIDLDTTPSVANTNTIRFTNTAATTVTDLDDAEEGDEVLLILDDNTTIEHGSGIIELDNGINFSPSSGGSLTLISDGGIWKERSRTVY